ncbi:MAG: DsbA family protein [Anaerolineaceae bacterium]|nr:DsbA family protein [Anaerolineaceae bacterium]
MEKKTKKDFISSLKNSGNVILCAAVTFVLGLLLGFFIRTKCGINTGREIALQYLEYMVAQPTTVDLSVLKSEPAAVYGSEDAPVKVKYFSDIQCPSCVTMFDESISKMVGNDQYQVEIYDFPFADHKYSRYASKYARCAAEQDVDYIEFIKKIIADYDEWSKMLKEANVSDYLLKTAVSMGADEDRMNLCAIGSAVNEAIDANIADGLALGIKGTPSYTIGDGLVQGYVSQATLSKLVEQSLKAPAAEFVE